MKSLLHTLDNSESILLMYLFDELPADDRAEVEEMLRTDAGLRAELEQLAAAHESVIDVLETSDSAARAATNKTAVRNAYRAIDQWNTRRLLTVPQEPARRRSLKWVAYSAGIAAMFLVGFLFYWGMESDTTPAGLPANRPEMVDRMNKLIDSFGNQPDAKDSSDAIVADARAMDNAELLRKSLDPSEDLLNDSLKHVDLNAAEQEINAVAQLSDPSTINGGLNFQ